MHYAMSDFIFPSNQHVLNTSAWDSIVPHKITLQELSVLIISHGISVMKTCSMQEWVTVPNL
jgi:hypothetical protein